MKIYLAIVVFFVGATLSSCGNANDSNAKLPFTGRVEFKGNVSLFATKGEMLFDSENQKVCYKIDAIKNFMGIDIIPVIDVKNQTLYMYNPEKKIYSIQSLNEGVEGEMPSDEEVEKLKKTIKESLKPTGNAKEIAGINCDEYVFEAEELGAKDVSMWFNKPLMDQMGAFFNDIPMLKESGLEDLLIGFPMEAKGFVDGQSGSFAVTKVTESNDVLAEMIFDGYEKVDEEEFLKIVIAGTPMEEMMNQMLNVNIDEEMEGLESQLKEVSLDKTNDKLLEEQ